MNPINYLHVSLSVIILIGCNTKTSKTVETRSVDQGEEILNLDEEISNQKIKQEFKLTDDNVINFLFEYEKNNKENQIRIYTNYGDIDILLFSNTPYHRSNFICLTKTNYFEGTQFYRVVNDFVIQAGNSDNIKTSLKRQKTGKYLLPNDFNRDILTKEVW